MKDSESQSLMDPSYMDGPTVKWTVADLFGRPPMLGMVYHVMSSGYDFITPVGAAMGIILYPVGLRPFGAVSLLQQAGNFGLMGGGLGMTLGAAKLTSIVSKGVDQPRPWDEEGMQDRLRGVQHNFKVRVMDLSVWTGVAVAGGTLLVTGGPKSLRLAPGTLGVLQALSIGSTVGSLAGIGRIISSVKK